MAATTDYFADLEGFGTGPSLPSPSDTPYQTPRPSMSRRSSRHGTASRGGSSSPPPMPSSSPAVPASSPNTMTGSEYKNPDDVANDETISILDPRRFTPTLHANLVSEILSLRRELDSKHKFIEDLESNLQSTKHEKEDLYEKLQNSDKDRRNLKRQFQQLEHGTLAALEELAKDRDSAKESNADLRQKLEAAQKRIRTHEDDHERVQSLWDKDKQAWEAEKRTYERRVHIAETRLKTVLEELTAQHATPHFQDHGAAEEEDNAKDSGVGDDSDTASVRSARMKSSPGKGHKKTTSNSSRYSMTKSPTKGFRMSTASIAGRETPKPNGISLADELDEEDEDCMELEEEDEDYPENELRARRVMESRQGNYADEKAKRVLGLMNENEAWNTSKLFGDQYLKHDERSFSLDETLCSNPSRAGSHAMICPDPLAHSHISSSPHPRTQYVDAATDARPLSLDIATFTETRDQEHGPDHAASQDTAQAEKAKPAAPMLIDRGQQMSPEPQTMLPIMISASSQTIENPPSPPATPVTSQPSSPPERALESVKPSLVTASTQTDRSQEPETRPASTSYRAPIPSPLPIPAIVIDPPLSCPPSPGVPLLPPRTKNAQCQTTFTSILVYKCSSVQTEEIRIDKRLAKLPAHLLPSSISSNPPSPEPSQTWPIPPRQPAKKLSNRLFQRSPSPLIGDVPSSPPTLPSPTKVENRYPGNNDNGPLADIKTEAPRRPFRDSSLFAGFDELEEPPRESLRLDRTEVEQKSPKFTTPAAPHRMKSARHVANRPSPVPEDKEVESKPRPTEPLDIEEDDIGSYPSSMPPSGRTSMETRPSFEKGRSGKTMGTLKSGGLSRQSSIRRSALIQSGAAAHAQRSRTPSIVSVGSSQLSNKSAGPPFPVPDRASSRRLFPHSKSEGSQSPTPRSGGLFGTRRPPRQLVRKDSLRKVRSATAIQRPSSKGRRGSRSPSPTNVTTPLSPGFPPLPRDNIAMPQKVYASQRLAVKTPNGELGPPHEATGSADMERASQGTVVDAIAACMVGEWMYKYVRRRKSFGVPESPQEFQGRPGTDGSVNVTGNGVRHKRWVWLSPYERAVMWSSKQPVSNSALMGKSGRKLAIQSVLDVRDDTPLPKNHGIPEPFNRSILILTPARALKFTAMSRERHYTWLTALSFLAHSPVLASGLADLPRPPRAPETEIISGRRPSLDRSRIRDSVRIAKEKSRPQPGLKLQNSSGLRSVSAAASVSVTNGRDNSNGHSHGHGHAHSNGTLDSEPISDCAEPPNIPRFSHGRKRSLTGPRLPSSALRRLAYEQVPTPSFSTSGVANYANALDYGSPTLNGFSGLDGGLNVGRGGEGTTSGTGTPSLYAPSHAGSLRTSEGSTSGTARRNFFDAVGTMRMEAFIEEGNEGFLQHGLGGGFIGTSPGGVFPANIGRGRMRRGSAWSSSAGTTVGGSGDMKRGGMVLGDDFDAFGVGGSRSGSVSANGDPFKGF